jgi:predicted ATPase/DNA-binding CsgD family transcriptional regulator
MELIERDSFLSLMRTEFEKVSENEGHSILVSGEAGIGKTSLVKAFCKSLQKQYKIYQGTCDALFTPRPLGPILDIIWQMQGMDGWANTLSISDRSALFSQFYHELANQQESTIIVIEDIHWADEATLDFIKFFARRINRLHCLFILTYRDDEIHTHHPFRTVLGQLSPDSFTRLQLTHLSRQAVEKMSIERGYNGEDVYSISGGNPFYVNEILANYSIGVPDNIRDSVLSSFNRLDEKTKQIWEILSVLPTGLEIKFLEKMEPAYATAIHNCLDLKILIPKNGLITFKHELYRRTIENSLSPLTRMSLNKRILDMFRENFEKNVEIERIIHHAKNANENEIVVEYAPLAARQAAAVGAHIEASKLYLTAIEYYHGNDKDILLQFYESYAYECYLTNQIAEAIIYASKALNLSKEKNDIERTGNCMRFLSRLWWYHGNGKKAETYASQAIQLLADQPSSSAKAMALSNMSQLKMLSYEFDECISWGEKAIAMAKELADEEILCHALNNVGTTLARVDLSRQKGTDLLKQSLEIALKKSLDEHAGRAYVNLASNAVKMKDYAFAKKVLTEGIQYCEERDIDAYTTYLLAFKARLSLEIENWNEAYRIAEDLIKKEDQPPVVKIEALVVVATVKMRRGDDALPLLLEAKEKAFETMEPQRIIPAIIALLEYEWITGKSLIEKTDLDYAITSLEFKGFIYEKSEFSFWLLKARKQKLPIEGFYEGYNTNNAKLALKASGLWKQLGCLYKQALTLFEGNDDNKREAIEIIDKLGAEAICEKMKFEMRASGIKKIPRGTRKSTKSNPANLTGRELDVLQLLKDDLQNKEIAAKLFISPKTVDHHISAIFFKLDVNSRTKAVQEAIRLAIIK